MVIHIIHTERKSERVCPEMQIYFLYDLKSVERCSSNIDIRRYYESLDNVNEIQTCIFLHNYFIDFF